MTPDVACLCLDDGIHCALTVTGQHRDLILEEFRQRHTGPGHLPENPPRDWHKKEAAFARHLARVRATIANQQRLDSVEVVDTRPTDEVKAKGGLL